MTNEQLKSMSPMERLIYWIKERQSIYVKKEAKERKPWTDCKILQSYRFCNVYREQDTVTKWISDHWRKPYAGHEDLWFAMAVARWVNWPDTLEAIMIENVLPWDPKAFISTLKELSSQGEKVWTGAYMIGTQGNAKDKPLFIAEDVLTPLWNNREKLRPQPTDTLHQFAQRIIAVKNQGKFMVGQIVADIKYDKLCPLFKAKDWHTFAVSGPGSRRGMNRLLGKPLDGNWNEAIWHSHLMTTRNYINMQIKGIQPALHAQDCQSALCEFDKFERVLWGQGKPRSKYNGI